MGVFYKYLQISVSVISSVSKLSYQRKLKLCLLQGTLCYVFNQQVNHLLTEGSDKLIWLIINVFGLLTFCFLPSFPSHLSPLQALTTLPRLFLALLPLAWRMSTVVAMAMATTAVEGVGLTTVWEWLAWLRSIFPHRGQRWAGRRP